MWHKTYFNQNKNVCKWCHVMPQRPTKTWIVLKRRNSHFWSCGIDPGGLRAPPDVAFAMRSWPLLLPTFSLSLFFSVFCFWPTSKKLPRLKICFSNILASLEWQTELVGLNMYGEGNMACDACPCSTGWYRQYRCMSWTALDTQSWGMAWTWARWRTWWYTLGRSWSDVKD